MDEIKLRDEHTSEIDWYINEFKMMEPRIADAQQRFDGARRKVEVLQVAMERVHTLKLTIDDNGVLRQAEMLAYFLTEARKADEELALLNSIVITLREALTLFLIEAYNLDPKATWTLNAEKGVLLYDSAAVKQ